MMSDKLRRYGQWAGSPRGFAEDTRHCIAEVYSRHLTLPGQCSRKRGHGPDGLYCKQHAKKLPPRRSETVDVHIEQGGKRKPRIDEPED